MFEDSWEFALLYSLYLEIMVKTQFFFGNVTPVFRFKISDWGAVEFAHMLFMAVSAPGLGYKCLQNNLSIEFYFGLAEKQC